MFGKCYYAFNGHVPYKLRYDMFFLHDEALSYFCLNVATQLDRMYHVRRIGQGEKVHCYVVALVIFWNIVDGNIRKPYAVSIGTFEEL